MTERKRVWFYRATAGVMLLAPLWLLDQIHFQSGDWWPLGRMHPTVLGGVGLTLVFGAVVVLALVVAILVGLTIFLGGVWVVANVYLGCRGRPPLTWKRYKAKLFR